MATRKPQLKRKAKNAPEPTLAILIAGDKTGKIVIDALVGNEHVVKEFPIDEYGRTCSYMQASEIVGQLMQFWELTND